MGATENGTKRSGAALGRGLRWKIVGLTGGSMALLAAVLVGAFAHQDRIVLREQLAKRGRAVALGLANDLAAQAFEEDRAGLELAASATVRDLGDVAYVVLLSPRGEAIAVALHPEVPEAALPELTPVQVPRGRRTAERHGRLGELPMLEVSAPMIFDPQHGQQRASAFDPLGLSGGGSAPQEKAAGGGDAEGGSGRKVGYAQVGIRTDVVEEEIAGIIWRALLLGLVAFLGCLAAALLLARMLTVPLERLSQAAGAVASGAIDHEVEVVGHDEIGHLAESFRAMALSLRGMLGDLRAAATQVETETTEILGSVNQQSAMATQQAAAIQETSTTVTEIAQTSRLATEHADKVIEIAQRSEDLSQDGRGVVAEAMSAMENLGEQVKTMAVSITELSERTLQIGDIIATVKELAEQSNLLALNASIEASKAGEHGRGFAVVAMEMRNLAEQSKAAAGQVRAILSEVQKGTRAAVAATEEGSKRAQAAVALARRAGNSIEGLAEVIRESAQGARRIAESTRQQTIGVEQIVQAITELSGSVHDGVEGTHRISRGTENLTMVSRRLTGIVNRYRV